MRVPGKGFKFASNKNPSAGSQVKVATGSFK